MGLFVKIAKSGDIQPGQGRMEWQFEDCAWGGVNGGLGEECAGLSGCGDRKRRPRIMQPGSEFG